MIAQNTQIVRKSKKPKKVKKESPCFPNLLENRNVVSKPNTVWVLDGIFVPTQLEDAPVSEHHVLFCLDLATNKIIFSKIFYFGLTKKSFSLKVLNKKIKEALNFNDIHQEILIHSDRGGQFCSHEWCDFINNHPYTKGSMTTGASPEQNAVIERFHRTYKSQMKRLCDGLPPIVKQTRDLQSIVSIKSLMRKHSRKKMRDYQLNISITRWLTLN